MRARLTKAILPAVACLLVGGCSTDSWMSRLVRPADDALARAYFDSVRFGRIDYAVAALGPRADSIPGVRDSLVRLSQYLPAGPLDSVHIIAANRFTSSAVDQSSLTYEYHSMQGWGVVVIGMDGIPPARFIQGIRVNRLSESLERSNAFTFRGKSAGHYLMLLTLLVCLGSAVWVAVLALRTKMRRRWAWALLAIVGGGTVAFNWTTGQVGFSLFSFLLLNAAFARAGSAAPWVFQAAFPIGAIMTWRRIQQARSPVPPTAPIVEADTRKAGESPVPGSDSPVAPV